MTYTMSNIINSNNLKMVISTITSLTLVLVLISSVNFVNANHNELGDTVEYGTLNLFHEDVSHVEYNDEHYVNVVFENGNGKFVKLSQVVEMTEEFIKSE